jgi:hypothetical protein
MYKDKYFKLRNRGISEEDSESIAKESIKENSIEF